MRLPAVAVAVLAAVGIAVYALTPVDEDEQVRDTVRRAVQAFSNGRISDCLDTVDMDFEDRSGGRVIDRETIRAALLGAFGNRRRGSGYVAQLGEDGVIVRDLDAEAGRAGVDFTLRTLRLPPGSEYVDDGELVWEVAIEAELARDERGTWRFIRSAHRTLAGTAPYR